MRTCQIHQALRAVSRLDDTQRDCHRRLAFGYSTRTIRDFGRKYGHSVWTNDFGALASRRHAQGIPVIARLRQMARSAARTEFGRNALWVTALSVTERAIAVVQTIIIARALGITDYGVYGLLFGTIGFVASILGLQMGLTATVYLARFRLTEKAKAAAVISLSTRFAWTVAIVTVIAGAPFSARIAGWLVQSDDYGLAVVLGILFVAFSIVSGVQDGIAQGFEIFRTLARIKVGTTLATVLFIYPIASRFGLNGVLATVLGGLFAKYLLLGWAVARKRDDDNIPVSGSGVTLRQLAGGFAVPSMMVSLGTGFLLWLGTYVLSRQPSGFDEVAIVNAGLQWRGPLFLLTLSIGSVAVPAFSRLEAKRDDMRSTRLRTNLIALNGIMSLILVAGLILASGPILRLYGPSFVQGQFVFCIVLLSCLPQVVTNVIMQQWVGAAKMWRVLWSHLPHFAVWLACILLIVPGFRSVGFAVSLLIAAVVLLSSILLIERWSGPPSGGDRRTVSPVDPAGPRSP